MRQPPDLTKLEVERAGIYICRLDDVNPVLGKLRAGHLLTFSSHPDDINTPSALLPGGQHLRLTMNDLTRLPAGADPARYILPDVSHIKRLLAFARAWRLGLPYRDDEARRAADIELPDPAAHPPPDAPLLLHCWAGISRSPAAGFILACAFHPDQPEHELAIKLRQASPSATPNLRMIEIADDYLGRQRRMVDAIKAIGRGQTAPYGTPFRLL